MELTEPLENINKRLIEHYGIDTSTSQPIWRVVFSDDQYENRLGTYDDYTDGGIFLRTIKEVRYTKKYTWVHGKYILEQLVAVPIVNVFDLPDSKVSYELLHVFEDKYDNPLPPKWEACKFIIDLVYAVKHGNHLPRYADPETSVEEARELQQKKINEVAEALFGDDSSLMGATIDCGSAIIVPRNYEKVSK